MTMIETESLTRKFGDLTAVDDLTLSVKDGEVFGFLGPNGAGKTTTVRMLCCLISKTSGEARIGQYQVGKGDDCTKIRRMIGFLPEEAGLYSDMSVYRNLDFYGKMYRCSDSERKERIEHFLKMLDLWNRRDDMAATLSKGMRQKLAICRALIHDPEILFLDEPTANLDPEASKTVRDFIVELKKEKKTIFLNTHHLDEAQRICDRVGVLKTRLLAVGSPEELGTSLWGKRTAIQLERVTDAVVAAVRNLGLKKLEVSSNRMMMEVPDPEHDNPRIIEAIVAAGGRIQFVTEMAPTLEDVYLKLVRG